MSAQEYPIFNVTHIPKIVPVVLPPSADKTLSGKIRNLAIRGADSSGWLADDGANGWTLTKAMEKKGYTMLEDRYNDEQNPEGWAQYKGYLKAWHTGKTSKPFPFHLLPKAVQNLQLGIIEAQYQDPWDIPAPVTTGVVSEPKAPKAK